MSGIVVIAGWLAGCDFLRTSHTCAETKTCPPSAGGAAGEGPGGNTGNGGTTTTVSSAGGATSTTGAGSADGTTAGAGGTTATAAGGASTSSGGPSGTGGTVDPPCDGACGGATPECDETTDTCVECLKDKHCTEGVCDPDAHACVECLDDDNCDEPTPLCDEEQFCVECEESADCTDPQASVCEAGSCSPCQTNEDCAHLVGTTVCDVSAGQCVECTGTDYASCGLLDGTPRVCDSLQKTCTDQKEHSAGVCNICVADAECRAGQRCARETFEGTELEYRCFWERGADIGGAPANCPSVPPYVATRIDVTTVDGTTADLCTLNVSTCKAHQDFTDNVDCEATPDVPDPSMCGEPDLNDAGCALYGLPEDNVYLCTVRCGTNNDCPEGASTCDTSASPDACLFNL